MFQIDSKTGKEVQCLLDELFTFDEAFMAKLVFIFPVHCFASTHSASIRQALDHLITLITLLCAFCF